MFFAEINMELGRPSWREQSTYRGELEAASNNRGPIWKGTRLPGTIQAKTQLTTLPGVCLYPYRPSTGFERRETPGVAGRGFSYRGTERKLMSDAVEFPEHFRVLAHLPNSVVPHDMSMRVAYATWTRDADFISKPSIQPPKCNPSAAN